MSGLSSSNLDSFLATPTNLSENFIQEHKDEVLLLLVEMGVSYPTEIHRETSLHIETVNRILMYWAKRKIIRKINPDRWHPQSMFTSRMSELWAMGFDSYEKLCKLSFWIPTLEGVEYIKVQYKGKGKQVASSLVKYYEIKVDEDDD